jgi:co-chaperonin GroES (HSP10)
MAAENYNRLGLITDTAKKKNPKKSWTVVAVETVVRLHDLVKVGDTALYGKYAGTD